MFQSAVLILVFLTVNICHADTVVRLNLQQGDIKNVVDLKLFEDRKPITVSNFMSYIADNSYSNSFIHRSVPGFIIQGGGYWYDPNNLNFITSTYPKEIVNKGTIINEPGISNLRGTITMAKVAAQFVEGGGCTVKGPSCTLIPGTGEDSATSEWFINLADNSANLDSQNGGFTVFGEVLNDGMQVIDSIASLPTSNIGGPFNEIPLVDYLVSPILTSHLVQILSVEGLFKITGDYDFGTVTPLSNLQPEFFIENISDQNLAIGFIGNNNPVEGAFVIKSSGCVKAILLPGEKCAFVVAFRPLEESLTYSDSFNVEFPELGLDYTVNVTGQSSVVAAEPDISQAFSSTGFRSANYGNVDVSDSAEPVAYLLSVGYQNIGSATLNLISVDLVTAQPDEFALEGNCLISATIIKNQTCTLTLLFTPFSIGDKQATIRIVSDDPDEGVFDFVFNAKAVAENDGVDDFTENSGPNNGDGNYDGILDSKQSNVVSIADSNGQYMILTGAADIRYHDVQFIDRSMFPDIPDNVAVNTDVFKFTISDIKVTENIKIGMILPAAMAPESFYIFGINNESATQPVWFEFSLDAETQTGGSIISGATLTTDAGQTVAATFVTLLLKNSVRGDTVSTADNELTVIGAFYDVPNNDSSGRLHIAEICFLVLLIFICRLLFSGSKFTVNKTRI